MNLKHFLSAGVVAISLVAGAAQAAVIVGPALSALGHGWTTTGLGFKALDNSHLTSFTYQNQGAADTIVLTDSAGNILHSIGTASGNTSDTVSVNWALTSGQNYWLLQTVVSNELFAGGAGLPSDADIAITQSGTFAYSIPSAVTGNGWGASQYWAAFNNITTAGVPEPASWAMMMFGVFGVGALMRRRKAALAA